MKHKGLRVFLVIAIFASLGLVAYKVTQNIRKNRLAFLDYVPEAALHVMDFHRTKVEGGRKVWDVAGEEARYLKAEKEAVIKRPRIVFYAKSGDTIEVTGNEGRLFFTDQDMEKMQLQGEIQVNYQGFVLETDEILYLKSTDQMISPAKVIIRGEGLELEGIGMEISLQDEKFRLLQKVKTKLQPEQLGNKRTGSNGKKEAGR